MKMQPFNRYEGVVVPLDRVNVDTDQIIPKQFLKLVQRTGFGKYLFYDWRSSEDGKPNKGFILNDVRYKDGKILLTRANFGCGSSREHAVWALVDYGFKALIAPSYADIFYNNCFKNGLLTIALPGREVDNFFEEVSRKDRYTLRIELETQTVTKPDGQALHFEVDPFMKKCLLEGLDEVSSTLNHDQEIRNYELQLKPFQRVEIQWK